MAHVKIGSARIDERGRAVGGVAGDQTGKEVSTQSWYKHSKGWVLLRCIVPGMAEYIARAMEAACANGNIGYDQAQNQTLWDQVASKGYDPAQATKPTETDCARLVRVCVQYAIVAAKAREGYVIPDFYTATLASKLVKSGMFKKLTESKYVNQEDYLLRGDILVTKTKGHTVVVLSNGSKVETDTPAALVLGDRILKDGMEGADVAELQGVLTRLGHELKTTGTYDVSTRRVVRTFQAAHGCDVDGEVGPETLAALRAALEAQANAGADSNPKPKPEAPSGNLTVAPGTWNVRCGPGTSYPVVKTVHGGDRLQEVVTDWKPVLIDGTICWISPKALD